MSLYGPRSGSWYLSSVKDPRWNGGGTAETMSSFALPREAKQRIKELTQQLGEPPYDLEFSAVKD